MQRVSRSRRHFHKVPTRPVSVIHAAAAAGWPSREASSKPSDSSNEPEAAQYTLTEGVAALLLAARHATSQAADSVRAGARQLAYAQVWLSRPEAVLFREGCQLLACLMFILLYIWRWVGHLFRFLFAAMLARKPAAAGVYAAEVHQDPPAPPHTQAGRRVGEVEGVSLFYPFGTFYPFTHGASVIQCGRDGQVYELLAMVEPCNVVSGQPSPGPWTLTPPLLSVPVSLMLCPTAPTAL